jgi:hypothetical protein
MTHRVGDRVISPSGQDLIVIDVVRYGGVDHVHAERAVSDAERATLDALLLHPARESGPATAYRKI